MVHNRWSSCLTNSAVRSLVARFVLIISTVVRSCQIHLRFRSLVIRPLSDSISVIVRVIQLC